MRLRSATSEADEGAIRGGTTMKRLAILVAAILALVLVGAAPAMAAAPTPLGTWGSGGAGDGQFNNPNVIGLAPNGTVYVADTNNNRIQYFRPSGAYLGQWGGLNQPTGVSVAANGNVYVAEVGQVKYFGPGGTYLGHFGNFSSTADLVVAVYGNNVYVLDYGNNQVQYFSTSGTYLGQFGGAGSGDGQFNGPYGMGIASDGTIYVADNGNNRVEYFSSTGAYQGQWSAPAPSSVDIGPNGTVYVLDFNGGIVRDFSRTGTFQQSWGSFSSPNCIRVSPTTGVIYVTDSGSNSVKYFQGPSAPPVANTPASSWWSLALLALAALAMVGFVRRGLGSR
jgi:DNA-binding beta-propeller fold protein YncE